MNPETVHTIINDLGALLLFTMILIIAAGQIHHAILAVAAQSSLIAVAGGVLARELQGQVPAPAHRRAHARPRGAHLFRLRARPR